MKENMLKLVGQICKLDNSINVEILVPLIENQLYSTHNNSPNPEEENDYLSPVNKEYSEPEPSFPLIDINSKKIAQDIVEINEDQE